MNCKRYIAVITLLLAASACGGVSVTSDWDPSFDFSPMQTFTNLGETGGDDLPPFMEARVNNAITEVMVARGLREVADTSQADLAVGFQFTSEQRSSYQTVNTGWGGYGYGGYPGWYSYGGPMMTTSTTTERRYEVGQLIIAVFDTEARAMVFASTGSKTLSQSQRTPEQVQAEIDDAVAEILRDFPPGG